MSGDQSLAKLYGTECFFIEFEAQTLEFSGKDPVVEFCIMSNDDAAFCNFNNAFGNLIELRGISQHTVVDACKIYHERLNFPFRVDKADKLVLYFMAVMPVDGNFSNAFLIILAAGCFYV